MRGGGKWLRAKASNDHASHSQRVGVAQESRLGRAWPVELHLVSWPIWDQGATFLAAWKAFSQDVRQASHAAVSVRVTDRDSQSLLSPCSSQRTAAI